MVTVEQILEYLERRIAEHHLAGDRLALKRDQDVAGFLMAAARDSGDKQLALRFQVLAARAADMREQLEPDAK
ncbi:MAG: hypothetical protein RMJ55_12090 [Roseiflexaceae bacterium]|nr:hypothetical protein [Roseiflexaceae bacterium]